MILTLHNLAKTYKILPSEALARASTFDLYVFDTYNRWVKYEEAKQKGKAMPVSSRSINEDKMRKMLSAARSDKTRERFRK